jgi:catechol 2,3-dioxygenase-like lactoylglutathione lyase family enzyme
MKATGAGLASMLAAASSLAAPTAERPKITGIASVRILVSDVEKARAFYSGLLGLGSGAGCAGRRACLSVNGRQRVELVSAGQPLPSSLLAEVAFSTSDLDAMRRYLGSRGIEVGAITTGADGARRLEVRDPSGQPLAFVEPIEASFQAREGQVSARVLHAGFVVRDRAAEDRFYREVLGFRPYWQGGMKDSDTDWVGLQVPDGEEWIEYMLNVAPDASRELRGVMNHFALGVVTMEPAVVGLLARGLKTEDRPEIGRDGKWQFNVYDPDLTRVELMEFEPAKEPCCHPYSAPHPRP